MLNQLLDYCLNPYLLLILSVISIVLCIVSSGFNVELFVLVLFSLIMVLIAVRGALRYNLNFSRQILAAIIGLILVALIWDSLFLWGALPFKLRYTFFVGATLIRVGMYSYGWLLLVKALVTRQKVTDRTIITAIVAYLFIGIIWSFVYLMIWKIDPNAFHISVLREYDFRPWNLVMYFSFMTLTTVGYGDIIPVNKWAMALANFEAMMGSIYLTVIIARLVSLYGTSE